MRTNLLIGMMAFACYLLNEHILKHALPGTFWHHHANDVLAPLLLLSYSGIISRGQQNFHRALHSFWGGFLLVAASALVWEGLAPMVLSYSVADPLDLVAYGIGFLLFWSIHRSIRLMSIDNSPIGGNTVSEEGVRNVVSL